MFIQCINIRQVPENCGFQHLPRDLVNVNAWKIMFDPYIVYTIVIIVTIIIWAASNE